MKMEKNSVHLCALRAAVVNWWTIMCLMTCEIESTITQLAQFVEKKNGTASYLTVPGWFFEMLISS